MVLGLSVCAVDRPAYRCGGVFDSAHRPAALGYLHDGRHSTLALDFERRHWFVLTISYGVLGIAPVAIFENKAASLVTLIVVMAWRTIGYSMVMILAGLKGVDKGLLEAARVDGANTWQALMRIKLPLIKTPMLLSTIVLTMSNFNNNTVPLILTGAARARHQRDPPELVPAWVLPTTNSVWPRRCQCWCFWSISYLWCCM